MWYCRVLQLFIKWFMLRVGSWLKTKNIIASAIGCVKHIQFNVFWMAIFSLIVIFTCVLKHFIFYIKHCLLSGYVTIIIISYFVVYHNPQSSIYLVYSILDWKSFRAHFAVIQCKHYGSLVKIIIIRIAQLFQLIVRFMLRSTCKFIHIHSHRPFTVFGLIWLIYPIEFWFT